MGVASITRSARMQPPSNDSALVALGFTLADDGTLTAPAGSTITLAPIGSNFLERKIAIDGSAVTAVLARAAIKVAREAGTT
jgi:hypothetical protein